jgi:hypothetical protein
MIPILANLWAILIFLLAGSPAACLAGASQSHENLAANVLVMASSDTGALCPFDAASDKFHPPDGVIEERTEEENTSDPYGQLGFTGPVPLLLPTSPAPSAAVCSPSTKISSRVSRFSCLRC